MNRVVIAVEECKGCGLCVELCPKKCIDIGQDINSLGYQHAVFDSPACTACGICYFVCPEPGAVTVIGDKEETDDEQTAG
jgi:NAD-dependent dihydropyrimidine dehydrogenase PreA subunit